MTIFSIQKRTELPEECKAVKEKYFQYQQLDFINCVIQPKNLDDTVSAHFEKKSIIPDPGLVNPTVKKTLGSSWHYFQ